MPRFREVNDRMKAAEAEAARLSQELASLRAAASKPATPAAAPVEPAAEETPKPRTTQGTGDAQRLERLELQVKLGVNEETAAALSEYLRKGIEIDDALALHKLKNPGAFGPDVKRGFQNGTHASNPPATGRRQPPAPEEPTRAEQLAANRDLHRRQKMAIGFASEMVREQMERQMNKNR